MPTYLEVWEIFLDHEIQMAQSVGWKDGNAKISVLAGTRSGFAEFPLSCEIAPQRQNPLNVYSSFLKKIFFFVSSSTSGDPGLSNLLLGALGETCLLLAFKSS